MINFLIIFNKGYFLPFCLILCMLFVTGCKDNNQNESISPGVVVSAVKYENITPVREIVGQSVANKDVNFYARVEGILEEINFVEGTTVKKGAILFEIEKDQYQAQVDAAKASLKNAEASLRNAKIDYNRQKVLVYKNAVSQQIYDEAEAKKEIAIAEVDAAKARLKEAEINLGYTTVIAPFDGLIGLSRYDAGNLVGPQSGSLASIVSVNPIDVEFTISESVYTSVMQEIAANGKGGIDLSKLIPSLILPNNIAYPHKGEVNFSNNRVDPSTGTILVRAVFSNPDHILLPGQYVRVQLTEKKKKFALLIPQVSIQIDKEGHFIFVVDKNNTVEKRRVVLGSVYNNDIIVKKGLVKGELVISEGIQKVYPGITANPILKNTQINENQRV